MSNTRSRMCELKGCVYLIGTKQRLNVWTNTHNACIRKSRNTKELLTHMRATVCMQLIVNGTAILSQAGLALMMSAACLRLIRHIKGATVPEEQDGEKYGFVSMLIPLHLFPLQPLSLSLLKNCCLTSALTEVYVAHLIFLPSKAV